MLFDYCFKSLGAFGNFGDVAFFNIIDHWEYFLVIMNIFVLIIWQTFNSDLILNFELQKENLKWEIIQRVIKLDKTPWLVINKGDHLAVQQ